MLFSDSFKTLTQPAEGEFKDRGSRFIGLLFPVKTEDEAKELIKKIKKEHHAAAHHCWALVLGSDQSFQKSSDDREPAGTAGKPILRVLLSVGVTNVLAVVVRYFGGKLLGVPGLIHAYGEAVKEALNSTEIVEMTLYDVYFVPCNYQNQHELIRILKQFLVKFHPSTKDNEPGIIFEVKPSQINQLEKQILANAFSGIKWVQQISSKKK
ncbi:MAG: YigZ family protein [Bacteroidota bacterium]|nr:YigZ family protein [Bacteroidota bacterium]